MPFYIEILRREWERRNRRNSRYSMRAFAQMLRIDHSILSMIFSGKRIPSKQDAARLPAALKLGPDETTAFLQSIAETKRSRRLEKLNRDYGKQSPLSSMDPREISTDAFSVLSEWYWAPVAALTQVKGAQSDPAWIAQQLGISEEQARTAVDKLISLELLKAEGEKLLLKGPMIASKNRDQTNQALMARQKQVLQKSIISLENDPIEVRNHTSMTMAIDPKKIPIAKTMIEEFNRSLCKFLESGDQLQVYELTVGLFPIQGPPHPRNQK